MDRDVLRFGLGLAVCYREANIESSLPPAAHALVVLNQTRCRH